MALSEIRAGIVANLRAAYPDGVQIGKYILSSPTMPTLHIRLGGPLNYDLAMNRGLDEFPIILQGLAQRNEIGQAQIDEWASSGYTGVKAAVEADKKLGGAVNDLLVRTMSEPVTVTVGGVDALLAEWTITVYPEGDI